MTVLELRDYQQKGTEFLYETKRAILADDPGLGKTVQATEAIELPAMIICPTHLKVQWEDFLNEQHPEYKVVCATGTRAQREKLLAKQADVYIINMEMVATYDLPISIRTYIFDECHHLRNYTADKSRASVLLANRDITARVYMLSATPMWKSVADIFMPLRIMFPTVFTSYRDFVETWCNTIKTPYGMQIVNIKKSMRGPLKELLQPIMLKRTAKEIGRDLPPIINTIVPLTMPDEQRAVYKEIQRKHRLRYEDEAQKRMMLFNPIAELHTFRQITMASGKLEAAQQIIEDNGLPTLVGCWYKDHAKQMYDMLPTNSAVLLTGEVEATLRIRTALWAQRNKKHIVCTQAALTEGVNLYDYRQIIQLEEHYVPGTNEQFIKRVLRDRNDDGKDQTPILHYCIHVKASVDIDIHRTATGRGASIEEMMEHILS